MTTDAIEASFREEWGRIVATVIAATGDWDLAEELRAGGLRPGPVGLAA